MKSNNRNDFVVYHHSEENIELLPPESTGTSTYIETTEALAVVENHTTYHENITINGTNTGNAAMSSSLFCRSKCRIDSDVPDVARNLTWKDQFYESHDNGAADIIAAFDIDRTLYDRTTYENFKWFIWAPGFSILVSPLYFYFPPLAIIMASYYATLLLCYIVDSRIRNEKRFRINRMHIAIGTRGIYIDEAATPSSNDVICRTIISFGEIKECKVLSEYSPFYVTMYHKVTISTDDDYKCRNDHGQETGTTFPRYVIEGLQRQQKFVDIVNAMVERHSERKTTPTTTGTAMDNNFCREVIEVDALV